MVFTDDGIHGKHDTMFTTARAYADTATHCSTSRSLNDDAFQRVTNYVLEQIPDAQGNRLLERRLFRAVKAYYGGNVDKNAALSRINAIVHAFRPDTTLTHDEMNNII